MNTKHDGRTAADSAKFLLQGAGLTDWQVGFLETALLEVAEHYGPTVTEAHCMNELLQMNSLHRGSIIDVAHALTAMRFGLSWHGDYESRRFFVDSVEKREPMKRSEFDALHKRLGWGSDAHRVVMGAIPA